MVATVQQVLRPLLIMSFTLGLGTYPMKQSNSRIRWIAHLSIFYCLTIWFFYACLFYYALSSFKCKMVCENIIFMTVITTNVFIAITSAIMNLYHQKKFEISLKKLSTVDDSLEELGVPKTYQRVYTGLKLVIIGWVVFSLIRIVSDAKWITNSSYFGKLYLSCIINHCLHINAFLDLLFIFLLWYVGTRFDKVNEYMRCLLVREDHGLKRKWKKSTVAPHRFILCTDDKQTLWTSMHLHLELCRIVRKLNFIFGTQITFGMAINLIHYTTICYDLYVALMQKSEIKETIQTPFFLLSVFSCCFLLLMRTYGVNYICQSVMDKANKVDKIVHQPTNTLRNADACQEVYQFTLQVMQRPLKLTGMNLFYLGNECLRKLCITVVTYVIIMVQMKIAIPTNENSV